MLVREEHNIAVMGTDQGVQPVVKSYALVPCLVHHRLQYYDIGQGRAVLG
jgi:hypothetical protein